MTPETMILEDGSEIVLIHFLLPTGSIACMPGISFTKDVLARGKPIPRSQAPEAVSCPVCKNTEFFKGKVGIEFNGAMPAPVPQKIDEQVKPARSATTPLPSMKIEAAVSKGSVPKAAPIIVESAGGEPAV